MNINRIKIILLCILFLNSVFIKAINTIPSDSSSNNCDTIVVYFDSSNCYSLSYNYEQSQVININNNEQNKFYNLVSHLTKSKKTTAIIIAILTGSLGGHRLYLGTKPIVPVFYACTLGCVGILAFIDIVVICFSKDISRFENNDKIIMWAN